MAKKIKKSNKKSEVLTMEDLLKQEGVAVVGLKKGQEVKGKITAIKNKAIYIDIGGKTDAMVSGKEFEFVKDYVSDLKPGDEIEAAVIDEENENGELELSFRLVGQEKAWQALRQALKDKTMVKVKIMDANKGGLLSRYCQIDGFLPVSQLAPENYPRISGGDKSKILEKLKSFVGQEFEVTVMTLNEEDNKIYGTNWHIMGEPLENWSAGCCGVSESDMLNIVAPLMQKAIPIWGAIVTGTIFMTDGN